MRHTLRVALFVVVSLTVLVVSCAEERPSGPLSPSTPTDPGDLEPSVGSYGNTCNKLVGTHIGTAGNDVITGTAGDDVILGNGGDDEIDGGGGNDTICGGDGHDTILGGDGDDFIDGEAGDDEIDGGAGVDWIFGGPGADVLRGGSEDDRLIGAAGENELHGDDGNDRLKGGDDDDRLFGGAGNDRVDGGAGDDFLSGEAGDDLLLGREGADRYKGGVDADEAKTFKCSDNDTWDGTVEVGIPACATLVLNEAPVGVSDAYFAVGHHELSIASSIGLVENDTDADADPLTATAETKSTTGGGTVTIAADGSFIYLSAAGFTGLDTFVYTVGDGTDTDTATATLRVDEKVYYVDNSFGGTSDGRETSPFTTIGAATAPAGAGEMIFVSEGSSDYDEGVVLEDTQALIGEGVASATTLTFGTAVAGEKNADGSGHETITLFAGGGTNPEIHRTSSGAGITLASSNTVKGLDVTTDDGAGMIGGAVGSLTVNPVSVDATGGPALDVSTSGALDAEFSSLSSTNSPSHGIRLVDVTDTVTASGGAITEATSEDVLISGGTANVTYDGTITDDVGTLVSVTGATGGTKDFNGAITDGDDEDGSGISLTNNTGATIRFDGGLILSTGANPAFTATGGGTVVVPSTSVTTKATTSTGTAVNIASTTIGGDGVTFDTVSTNGAANGILIDGAGAGAFTGSGGTIVNASARGVDVNGGTGNVTYNGTISTTAAGRSVEVMSRTGGTVAIGGAIDENGSGIRLNSNSGATINFTGGLDIDTGTTTGFSAIGGGTVNVTQNNTTIVNTIDTSTGPGLNIQNTTIGGSGVTFRSISVNGAASGIVLNATGSTGAFEVTGTGTTDASGGTIRNTTGNGVSATNFRGGFTLRNMVIGDATASLGQSKDATNNVVGDGIDLNGVDDVVLANMRIARTGGHGIDGTDVSDFSISDSEIFNAGDGNGENGISFDGATANNLDGTATITNTIVDGPVEMGLRIQNNAGTLALTVSGGQFSGTANNATLEFGEDGIQIEVLGTAQTTARIHNGVVLSKLESDGVMATTSGNGAAVLNLTIDGNTFTGFDDGAPNRRSDNAIELNATGGTSSGNAPSLRYTITNNTMTSSSNSAILIGGNDFTKVDGRITNNTISGSEFGYGIEGNVVGDDDSVTRLLVTNNAISDHNQGGAFFNANNSADLDLAFDNNTVSTRPTDTTFFENVTFQITNGALCVASAGNTVALGGADAFGAGVGADPMAMIRTGGTAQLEVGSANLADPAKIVLETNNPGAASAFTSGTISVVANSTCVDPIVTPLP